MDQKADQTIAAVLQPGKTAEAVTKDLKDAYKDTPNIDLSTNSSKDTAGEELLAFPIMTVQKFVATKLDRDRLFEDTLNLSQQLDLEKQTNANLTSDYRALTTTHALLVQTEKTCEDTVAGYKKIVVVSKWQKVWNGTKKGVEVAVALLVGYELGRKL